MKYAYIELKTKGKEILNLNDLSQEKIDALEKNNVIYIYMSTNSNKFYIGQTSNFLSRHAQHYNGREVKFNTANFNHVIVLVSVYFENRTALDDVEKQLITYFNADRKNARRMFVAYDNDVVNRTQGNRTNDYTTKEKVATEVVLPFWERVLFSRGWVNTKTLDELRTSALVKYSPIKQLTDEQNKLIDEIIKDFSNNYVINGDAGTGKTVLLTHLVARFLERKKNVKIGVVVQPNWETTCKEIFNIFGMNCKNLDIATSTKIIKKGEKYDVIIVDESHKLSRKGNKQMAAFNKVYEIEEYKDCQSHLEVLQQIGKQIILMYDVLQAIRPANISRDEYEKLTSGYKKVFLKTQFRIQTPKGKKYTSEDYINGIKYFLYKDTGLLDSKFTQFNKDFDKSVFNDKAPDAYFGYFEDKPLHHIIDWLEDDENYNPEHVNRVLAGLVEDWCHDDGKDETKMHFYEDDIQRRWNSTQDNWINSKDSDAKEQVGSVFAVQGIDLNKVGVLIGKDLQMDENGHLFGSPDDLLNSNCKFKKSEMPNKKNKDEFTLFVLNMYYVLLTRGIDGIRVGFWKNDSVKKYMKATLGIK